MWRFTSPLVLSVGGCSAQAIAEAKLLDVSANCLKQAHKYIDNSQVGLCMTHLHCTESSVSWSQRTVSISVTKYCADRPNNKSMGSTWAL